METVQSGAQRNLRSLFTYAVMLAVTLATFFWIQSVGHLVDHASLAHHRQPAAGAGKGTFELLPHVLLALAVIVVASRVTGAAFRRIRQPAVMGEVIAGIALGPSLLGRIWPDAGVFLFPSEIVPA